MLIRRIFIVFSNYLGQEGYVSAFLVFICLQDNSKLLSNCDEYFFGWLTYVHVIGFWW